ncbi:hypothetical protein A4G20_01210 [Pasteurellaceae bacterium RH1A]|nr:hypothetical protein A4G20_01210 [Pasteurellaceae bacterium RH1A]
MQLKKIALVLLASLLVFNPLALEAKTTQTSKAKTAISTKKSTTKKSVKSSAKKQTTNETKRLYGVKGAKLQPTKVSTKRYSYSEKGKTYSTASKESSRLYSATGVASYYTGKFNGRKTANGEIFNDKLYTAAHKTLALGSYALVTNLRNGRQVIVKINDRGPFSKARIIDLSKAAAAEIGMVHSGVAKVRVEALQVDKDGYISGKGTQSLIRLAKKEGLNLKVRGSGDNLAVKAVPATKEQIAKANASKPAFGLKVAGLKSEKEAKQLARAIKPKTELRANGKGFDLVVHTSSNLESSQVKRQLARLTHNQIFTYSQK